MASREGDMARRGLANTVDCTASGEIELHIKYPLYCSHFAMNDASAAAVIKPYNCSMGTGRYA